MTRTLSRQDVEDILVGATFFGAGGGGELDEGLALIDAALAVGRPFGMVSLADVPDDALLCTPYLLGAVSDLPQGAAALIDGKTPPIERAFERLTDHLGQSVYGTVACELGGSNTAVPFLVAALAGAVVIDADPAGRAVPEITHSAYALLDLPVGPIVTANARGETVIVENIASDQRAEEVVRAIAQVSDNDIAAIDHALPAGLLRPALIPGTLSRCRQLGAITRRMRSKPGDLPDQIASATGGCVAFEGVVRSARCRTEGGFSLGRFEIAGNGAYSGQTCAIDLKNENMIAWHDGTPIATIPEIITVVDVDAGAVVTNPNATAGQRVSVLVLPAPEVFLTPRGLQAFGPGYAGLDAPFRPFVAI